MLTRDANRSYLANHSLGRPLDAMQEDVREATSAWYERLGDAWEPWAVELAAHRRRLATLLGAARADCVVPNQRGRGSAGRAEYLRPCRARAQHTRRVRLAGRHPARVRAARPDKAQAVEPDADGMFDEDALAAAIVPGTDLVVVSQAWFMTGQLLRSPEALVERAHAVGAKVLLDVYHALGVLPVDIDAIGADFAVGELQVPARRSGRVLLYVAPRHLDAGLATLDIGWFAKADPFAYARPDPPRYAAGGDAWMESTPAASPGFRRAPDRSSRWLWASSACAPIR